MNTMMKQMDAFSGAFERNGRAAEETIQPTFEQGNETLMESQEAKERLREIVMSNVISGTMAESMNREIFVR